MNERIRFLIGRALRAYLWHVERAPRCDEYADGCPSCILWRASDMLLEYGSDEEWTALHDGLLSSRIEYP